MQEGLHYFLGKCHHLSHNNNQPSIPIYSFLNQIISSLKKYSCAEIPYDWADYILTEKKPFYSPELIAQSWIEHGKSSLESQLLGSFLKQTDIRKLRLYLRLRKYIVQLTNIDMLDEIALRHEDVITIVHRIFPIVQIRKELISGVKQIFVSYKITDAKIYACVFVEYILSIYDSLHEQQRSAMVVDSRSNPTNISHLSSIGNFSSNMHKQNGLYRKVLNNGNPYNIIEVKFVPKVYKKSLREGQNGSEYSYYLSNSLSSAEDSQQKSQNFSRFSKDERDLSIKCSSNGQYNSTQMKQSHNSLKRNLFKTAHKEIVIQQQSVNEGEQEKQNMKINQIGDLDISKLIQRHRHFKDKMLSSKIQFEDSLGESRDSIAETISIIHKSVVRNKNRMQSQ